MLDPVLVFPWTDYVLQPSAGRVHATVTYGGSTYEAEYGGDPLSPGSVGAPRITAGGTWRQSKGYFYMWGYWRLLESERARTITWGTTVAGRFIEATSSAPAREQIFVECGKAVVIPKSFSLAPAVVGAGEYVELTGSVSGGDLAISDVLVTPHDISTPNSDEQAIQDFFAAVGHADPCNP